MNSLPTIEQRNISAYDEVIMKLDPALFMIVIALRETGVNPLILPKVIRALANLASGTGFGRIQIFMSNGMVTAIKPEESDEVNVKTIIIREEVIV